ncbi:MAG: hypothetical protein PHE68_00615 [Candidatus Peribacteraceae bacterium]|nr:hypothetical protein [Candidatus Peribacteraceae bacterium]MDD5075301.1 hypothetical protein [Candidatus Peribacteraceae bacterium]
MNKFSPVSLAALSLILLAGCAQKTTTVPTPPIVGGDRDAHGCIGSAGYTWCEAKKKCLRVWEEECFASAKEAIVWELTQKYEQRIRKEFTVTITQETKTHACGKISFGGPGTPGGMVLASKMTGIWRVVYEGNGSVDCAVLKAEEFPADMLKGFCD